MPDSKYVMQVCISFLSEWTNFLKIQQRLWDMTGEYNFVYRPDSVIPPALQLSLLPLDYTTVRFHFGPGHSCWKGAVFLIRLPVLTVAFAAMWTASQTRTVAISGGFLLLLSLNLWPRLNCWSLVLELQNILRELRLDIVLVARVSIMFVVGLGQ